MKLDEACDDRFVEVVVVNRVRIRIRAEDLADDFDPQRLPLLLSYLLISVLIDEVLPAVGIRAIRDHERGHVFIPIRPSLCENAGYLQRAPR